MLPSSSSSYKPSQVGQYRHSSLTAMFLPKYLFVAPYCLSHGACIYSASLQSFPESGFSLDIYILCTRQGLFLDTAWIFFALTQADPTSRNVHSSLDNSTIFTTSITEFYPRRLPCVTDNCIISVNLVPLAKC